MRARSPVSGAPPPSGWTGSRGRRAASRPRRGCSTRTSSSKARRRQRRLVVRRETDDPAVYPQQAPGYDCEVEIQYRTMAAIANHSDVPIAPLVGYEDDPSVLGAPFFVMGFVDGEVPVENPLYTVEGFFVDASPKRRRAMIEAGLRLLAGCTRSTGAGPGSSGSSRLVSTRAPRAGRGVGGVRPARARRPCASGARRGVLVPARAPARPRRRAGPGRRSLLGRRPPRQHHLAGIAARVCHRLRSRCRLPPRTRTSAGG